MELVYEGLVWVHSLHQNQASLKSKFIDIKSKFLKKGHTSSNTNSRLGKFFEEEFQTLQVNSGVMKKNIESGDFNRVTLVTSINSFKDEHQCCSEGKCTEVSIANALTILYPANDGKAHGQVAVLLKGSPSNA